MTVWPTPADRQAMVTAVKEQDTIRSRPTVFRTKSGGLITTLYSATLIEVDGLPCVLAAIQDITAQRMAEDALRESEAKFRLLAETAPCGIFIYQSRSDHSALADSAASWHVSLATLRVGLRGITDRLHGSSARFSTPATRPSAKIRTT